MNSTAWCQTPFVLTAPHSNDIQLDKEKKHPWHNFCWWIFQQVPLGKKSRWKPGSGQIKRGRKACKYARLWRDGPMLGPRQDPALENEIAARGSLQVSSLIWGAGGGLQRRHAAFKARAWAVAGHLASARHGQRPRLPIRLDICSPRESLPSWVKPKIGDLCQILLWHDFHVLAFGLFICFGGGRGWILPSWTSFVHTASPHP